MAVMTTNFLFLQIFVTFCLCASPLDLKQEAQYRSLHIDKKFEELHFDVHREKRQAGNSQTTVTSAGPADVTQGNNGSSTTTTASTTTRATTTLATTTTQKWDIKNDTHTYYNSQTHQGSDMSMKVYWRDIASYGKTVKHISLSDNHRTASTVRLSFDFLFYGHYVRNITIATGGFLYMSDFLHQWLTATQYIAPLMANFDSRIGNNSDIHYVDTGEVFIVWWQKLHLNDEQDVGSFTFQVQLHKDGMIHFVYKTIPRGAHLISTREHPVKVGLSDAYYYDQIITDKIKRRTIYEYHRVEIQKDIVQSSAAVIIMPLPTCVSITNCGDCVKAQIGFNCQWCTSLEKMRCSDGLDRHRQEWLVSKCHQQTPLKYDDCLALSTTTTTTKSTTTTLEATTTNPKTTKISTPLSSTAQDKKTGINCDNQVVNDNKGNNVNDCLYNQSTGVTPDTSTVNKDSDNIMLTNTKSMPPVTSNLLLGFLSTSVVKELHEASTINQDVVDKAIVETTPALKTTTASSLKTTLNPESLTSPINPESITSTVKSETTLNPESITSTVKSETTLNPESITSTVKSETTLNPESITSTVKSETTVNPESITSTVNPESITSTVNPESITSTVKSETAMKPVVSTTVNSPETSFKTTHTLRTSTDIILTTTSTKQVPTSDLLTTSKQHTTEKTTIEAKSTSVTYTTTSSSNSVHTTTKPVSVTKTSKPANRLLSFVVTISRLNNADKQGNSDPCKPVTSDECPTVSPQKSSGSTSFNNDHPDAGAIFFLHQGPSRKPEGGVLAAVIIIVVLILVLIGAVTGWFVYAYKNPNSSAGRWLIEHRPSQIRESLGKVAFWKKDGAGEKYGVSVGGQESVA